MKVVFGPLPYAVISWALVWVFGAVLMAAGTRAVGWGIPVYPLAVFLSSGLFALRKEVRSEWSSGYLILLGCALISAWLLVVGYVPLLAMVLLTGGPEPVLRLLFPFPGWLISFSYQTGAALLAGLLVLATRRQHTAKAG